MLIPNQASCLGGGGVGGDEEQLTEEEQPFCYRKQSTLDKIGGSAGTTPEQGRVHARAAASVWTTGCLPSDLSPLPSVCSPLCPLRCAEHEEPPGDLHHAEGPAAPGGVRGHGGRGAGALLQADPPHPQHLQEHEQ